MKDEGHKTISAATRLLQSAPVEQEPVLVRDAAEVLGVTVKEVCDELVKLGLPPRSTNMAISGLELLAVAAAIKSPQPAQRKPLTVDEVWQNDQLMSLNAELGCGMDLLMEAVEAAHGIKE